MVNVVSIVPYARIVQVLHRMQSAEAWDYHTAVHVGRRQTDLPRTGCVIFTRVD